MYSVCQSACIYRTTHVVLWSIFYINMLVCLWLTPSYIQDLSCMNLEIIVVHVLHIHIAHPLIHEYLRIQTQVLMYRRIRSNIGRNTRVLTHRETSLSAPAAVTDAGCVLSRSKVSRGSWTQTGSASSPISQGKPHEPCYVVLPNCACQQPLQAWAAQNGATNRLGYRQPALSYDNVWHWCSAALWGRWHDFLLWN